MPELMTGSHHSIDMVMSDSIDTVACCSLNIQAKGPPGPLNKSAQGVNHVTLLRDQKGKKEEEMERCRRKRGSEIMTESRICSGLQMFITAVASSSSEHYSNVKKQRSSQSKVISLILNNVSLHFKNVYSYL